MNDAEERNRLKRACDETLADLHLVSMLGADGEWVTYCNIALYDILFKMGWSALLPMRITGIPMLANEIVSWLGIQPQWRRGTGREAHQHARAGQPSVAGEIHPRHGHVAHIYPAEDMGFSPSLKKEVPFVANVGSVPHRPEDEGKDLNRVCKVSEAFPVLDGEPSYFLYTGNPKGA